MKENKNNIYQQLRNTYACFYFHSTQCEWNNTGELHIRYHFSIENDYHFYPEHKIKLPKKHVGKTALSDKALHDLAFHLGMVELVSYWKAACPPRVIIKEYALTPDQQQWWKKLYFQGLGEFFYTNGIVADMADFMQIECLSDEATPKLAAKDFGHTKVIVPVGGGKDSIVSLEVLKGLPNTELIPLIINPRGASINSVKNSGLSLDDTVIIHRSIHPQLLELNRQGFLNGHTPFSAMLAFTSLLIAHMMDIPCIALSNESSANEATVPDTNINHQYSKSFEFEHDFRTYYQTYISNNTHYFSFLRPVSELQIAALISQYHWHHADFRSCNVGSKTDSWCGHCPKCLFTYIMLSPFLSKPKLHAIFGKDLLHDHGLQATLDELRGVSPVKPFECVGTVEEVNIALQHAHSSLWQDVLLQSLEQDHTALTSALHTWNTAHALPPAFEAQLKQALSKL